MACLHGFTHKNPFSSSSKASGNKLGTRLANATSITFSKANRTASRNELNNANSPVMNEEDCLRFR